MFKTIGINLEKNKLSKNIKIVDAGLPSIVNIPLNRHIGAPAKPCVNINDKVKVGTLIAKENGVLSVNIYSSVSGKIQNISDSIITIDVIGDDFEKTIDRTDDIKNDIPDDKDFILSQIRKAGIVGLGGAGYPTWSKLSISEEKNISCLIVNGLEGEPYFTGDNRLMIEKAEEIVIGARIVNRLLGIQNAIIAVDEDNKEAVKILTEITKRYIGVNVKAIKTVYPTAAETQLIKALFGVEIGKTKLPIDMGYVVNNVGTIYSVYKAVMKNSPLFERTVTVSGTAVEKPQNYIVRAGTPASYLIEKVGANINEAKMLILDGLMMGKAIQDTNTPVSLLDGGLLLFKQAKPYTESSPCIRCNKCAANCPVRLQPYAIANYFKINDKLTLYKLRAFDCINCGNCSYICPAKIPLLDLIKAAKEVIR